MSYVVQFKGESRLFFRRKVYSRNQLPIDISLNKFRHSLTRPRSPYIVVDAAYARNYPLTAYTSMRPIIMYRTR